MNVAIPCGPKHWEQCLHYSVAMEILVRICQSGAEVQKMVATRKCLERILKEGKPCRPPKDLTDLTVVRDYCHWYFYVCTDVGQVSMSLAKGCRKLRRLNLASVSSLGKWMNFEHLIEGCPALEELNLEKTYIKPETYARLIGGLKKLKSIGFCTKFNDIAPLLKETPIGDIALEKIEAVCMNEQAQQIVFDRCRKVTSVNIHPPYHHLNLCRGLKELILYNQDFKFFLSVFARNSDTLSHLALSEISIVDVSDLTILCELPKLEWLELHECKFSFALRQEEELLRIIRRNASDLFPSLRCLTISALDQYHNDAPDASDFSVIYDVNVIYFLLNAAKDITRLELDIDDSIDFFRRVLHSVVLEKGSLKDLEDFITTDDIHLTMASFDLLLGNCLSLRSLGPLMYWAGLSKEECEACAHLVKEQNLDIDLTPVKSESRCHC